MSKFFVMIYNFNSLQRFVCSCVMFHYFVVCCSWLQFLLFSSNLSSGFRLGVHEFILSVCVYFCDLAPFLSFFFLSLYITLSLGVSICLDVVSIETLDLNISKSWSRPLRKSRQVLKTGLDCRDKVSTKSRLVSTP